ncbi:hypothetical protein A0O34_07875 [Chryseobacterium glaciei]|uniref:Uncharacterized protein n=1 Tax=Chryseobacterium glaciei TaxID=1685010 RepID=A0A172XU82_9FLAO|nr:hypothetical protein [Chryseobacterium glaciei]ANF50440.1 hypothetical protein A0O34_07875 [Chryseobacterium glaciei]
MKNILFILFSTIGLSLSAQVGVATPTPKAILDVNGNINLRGKLVVLNAADSKLSEGRDDQLLVSQGAGLAPTWKSLRIPDYETNKFYLIYNNSFSDRVGTTFTSSEEPTIASRSASFTKNSNISNFSQFKKIPGLSQTFNVYSTESKTYFQFETVIQANFATVGTTDTSIDYACGIFVDDKLVNLRQGNLKAVNSTNPFLTHNQIGLAQNLTKGAHSVGVACSRLKSYNVPAGITLGIGTSVSNNIDSFISQSSFKVDVYEVPQVFNAITN